MNREQKDLPVPADTALNGSETPADEGATSRATENAGYNQHGHGRGGKAGEGEPEGTGERDGTTQPNFGQGDTLGGRQE